MEEVAGGFDPSAFRFAVRTAAFILLPVGIVAAVWAALMDSDDSGLGGDWRAVTVTAGLVGAVFGGVLLLLGRHTPRWLLWAFPFITAALICAPALVTHQSTPVGSILLVWPVLFAGYLLPTRIAYWTLWFSLVLLVAIALRLRSGSAMLTCLEVGASLMATLYITVHLRSHNRSLLQALRQEARTDPLTGLANRRAFDEFLGRELSLYERHDDPLALLAIDVDHFKVVNDRAGHPAGDAALVALAAVLTGHVRRADLVARTGGEEFAIVLVDCETAQARQRAGYLRAVVAAESTSWPNPITVSIGVANIPDHALTSAQLLAAADAALYAAKDAGRNTVITSLERPQR